MAGVSADAGGGGCGRFEEERQCGLGTGSSLAASFARRAMIPDSGQVARVIRGEARADDQSARAALDYQSIQSRLSSQGFQC